MKLDQWIEHHGLRRVEFARKLGLSPGHVTDLCQARFWPTRLLAQGIWEMTGGEVTPNDFLFPPTEEEELAAAARKIHARHLRRSAGT
jgi:3,4-dihydroxy 2-butanone 4-phosphate synthase/GTP cyclohydrolase II